MADPWVTKKDVEDRLSASVVREIYDDNEDGTADKDPIARLIEDAQSYIEEVIDGIYALPLSLPLPKAIRRLTLDAVEMYAARRHPEYVRRDWEKIQKALDRDLDKLREQRRTLAQKPPDPAANQGGDVLSWNTDCPEPRRSVFVKSMGDF